MSELYSSENNKKIISDNYLVNSYNHLTRSKTIHFLFIFIEIFIIIFQELEIYLRDGDYNEIKFKLNYISTITNLFSKISIIFKLIIIILLLIIFDIVFIFINKKKFKKQYIIISILVNFLELFYFRSFTLILFNLIFTLPDLYFLISCIFLILHIYLLIKYFLYNHLYYFVPKFIDYPYDQFSSIFDIVLLFIKIFLSVARYTNDEGLEKFSLLIYYFIQIFFCIYFINLLKNHSYLFMKNPFINKTKFCFFVIKTLLIILILLLGKNNIINIFFLIICVAMIFIIMMYIYLIYNPLNYVKINRETPLQNILFYLFILSDKDDIDFLFKNKVNEHYESCGDCDLCNRYIQYLNTKKNNIGKNDDEKERLINNEKKILN